MLFIDASMSRMAFLTVLLALMISLDVFDAISYPPPGKAASSGADDDISKKTAKKINAKTTRLDHSIHKDYDPKKTN